MSRIFVTGWGAVSPAGWNAAALREALVHGEPLPVQSLERPGWDKPLRARLVPAPAARPEFLAHPRLRRSSPITHHAAAAALEALAGRPAAPDSNDRLGLVVCMQAGCVRYSCRFLDETLKDPATASPLLFPETVYAAPASHVAALLSNVSLACSLVGDPGAFLQAVSLAVQWLEEDRVDTCLVIGAEETNWILADALRLLDRDAIITSGAGALCLSRNAKTPGAVELAAITDPHTYSAVRPGRKRRTPCAPNWARVPPKSCFATASPTARAWTHRSGRHGATGRASVSVQNKPLAKDSWPPPRGNVSQPVIPWPTAGSRR